MQSDTSSEHGIRLSGLQLPLVVAPDSSQKTDRYWSLCQTTTYRWSLTEDLVQYAQAGIGGIGLYRPKVEEFDEELAIDVIRSSNLNISSLSWIGGFTGCDGSPQAEAIYDAKEAIKFAAAINAGTVALIAGGLGRHIGKQARRLMLGAIHELCEFADFFQVRLAIHPFTSGHMRSRTLIRSLADAEGVIKEINSPALGILLDIREMAADPDYLARIHEFVPYIHSVRLSDHRPRHGAQACRMGERTLRHATVIRELVQAGYEGPFEFDFWSDRNDASVTYESILRDSRNEIEHLQSVLDVPFS